MDRPALVSKACENGKLFEKDKFLECTTDVVAD